MTTRRAPARRATAAAIIPIGPAPVTSTSSPTRGNASAVCTALPSGSKMARYPDRPRVRAARCWSWAAQCIRRRRRCGLRPRLQCARTDGGAGEAVAATPAHHVALAADHLAGLEVGDVRSHRDDLSHKFMANGQPQRYSRAGPRIPLVNVQVGTADTRLQHAILTSLMPIAGSECLRSTALVRPCSLPVPSLQPPLAASQPFVPGEPGPDSRLRLDCSVNPRASSPHEVEARRLIEQLAGIGNKSLESSVRVANSPLFSAGGGRWRVHP